MTYKELHEKINDQYFAMKRGIANSMNHAAFYQQMSNVLMNNLDDIVKALGFAANAEDQIKVLELELNDAERDLDERDKQIQELKESSTKKTTSKKKSSAVANE